MGVKVSSASRLFLSRLFAYRLTTKTLDVPNTVYILRQRLLLSYAMNVSTTQ